MRSNGQDSLAEYEKARQGIRKSNFFLSFMFLDPVARKDLETFYLFCRVVDDIVDEIPDRELARKKLQFWEGLCQGEHLPDDPSQPLLRDLADLLHRREIPLFLLREIISGMAADLQCVRIPDIPALQAYCYQAAGAVGRACIPIFGGRITELGSYADRLGEAFQLTNILRDLKSDAARNRIYLPADRMAYHEVSEKDVLEGRLHPGFIRLMEEIWDLADRNYRAAESQLSDPAGFRIMKAARAMSVFYRDIHRKIRQENFQVYRNRIRLGTFRKGWLLTRFWIFSREAPVSMSDSGTGSRKPRG
ncbi:MAG: phytoene/squalene synthase family protein [Leptospirales bacterium]